MDNQKIMGLFEAYFDKYKKTEGDMSSWSAYWTIYGQGQNFEINLTKCPLGTRFKIFSNHQKIEEIAGWEDFLANLDRLESEHPLFTRSDFFTQMEEML